MPVFFSSGEETVIEIYPVHSDTGSSTLQARCIVRGEASQEHLYIAYQRFYEQHIGYKNYVMNAYSTNKEVYERLGFMCLGLTHPLVRVYHLRSFFSV